MLPIDLWQSHHSRVSLDRMHLYKQVEADAWVDSQKDKPEECVAVMKIYILKYLQRYSQSQSHTITRGQEITSKWPMNLAKNICFEAIQNEIRVLHAWSEVCHLVLGCWEEQNMEFTVEYVMRIEKHILVKKCLPMG